MDKNFILFVAILFTLLIIVIFFALFQANMLNIQFQPHQQPNPMTGRNVYGNVYLNLLAQCNFNIDTGWNFFSLCADANEKRIANTFENTTYRYVMRWNTTRMEWDIYSPRAAENSFDNMTINESYFVLVYSLDTMSLDGTQNTDMNISMIEGWDAPSWPYLFDANITKYFNETMHRYMMKWNQSGQEFLIYSPRATENPFTTIYRADGQMLYAYYNQTLVYNKTYLGS